MRRARAKRVKGAEGRSARLRPKAALVAFAALLALWLVPSRAAAQATVQATLSAEQVEVNQPFEMQVSAMTTGDATPSNPRVKVPAGVSIKGPSVGSNQQISIVNGRFEHRRGITATWTLLIGKAGRFVVGPASVEVGGRRIESQALTVEVVPQGTLPAQPRARSRRRRGFGVDPFDDLDQFDPFDLLPKGPLPPFGFGQDDTSEPELPSDFAVEQAPDTIAFLRATATPTEVVVGEQVTLRVYAYGNRGPFEEVNTSEPSRADFLSHVLVENSYRQPRFRMTIGDTSWHAVKLREAALFPVRAGKLTIGAMRVGFRGRGYPASAPHTGLVRHSTPIEIDVREPPLAGRPPGYQLGDVGQFSLSATVDPKRVEAGGAVRVTLTVEGTGNLPQRLFPPEQKGVEWDEPTVNEQIAAKGDRVGGQRRFTYVARLVSPGNVELGEVSFPYYDPNLARYETARAALGSVEVVGSAPAPSASAAAEPKPVALGDLLHPRKRLGPRPRSPWHLTDSSLFWWFLALGPAVVLVTAAALSSIGGVRRRWARQRESRPAQARRALKEAQAAAAGGDAARTVGAVERALYESLEEATGLKARALLRSELPRRLEEAGAPPEVARELVELLHECDLLRFASTEAGLDPRGLVERATQLIPKIARNRRPERRAA